MEGWRVEVIAAYSTYMGSYGVALHSSHFEC